VLDFEDADRYWRRLLAHAGAIFLHPKLKENTQRFCVLLFGCILGYIGGGHLIVRKKMQCEGGEVHVKYVRRDHAIATFAEEDRSSLPWMMPSR